MTSPAVLSHNPRMADDNQTIADRIDARIDELGLSKQSVQRHAGVSTTYLRDLRKGKSYDMRKLTRVARALDMSVWDLAGIENPLQIEQPPEPKGNSTRRFFPEDEIRRAVSEALALADKKTPDDIADDVVTILKFRSLEISSLPQSLITSKR